MLARAICQEPEIIILDEPTSYLDIKYKLDFLSILQEMRKKKELTVVMSLHELELAAKVSDKILCVNGSCVERFGTPQEIFKEGYIEKLFSFTGIGPFVKDYLCAGMTGKNKGENLKLLMEKENLKNCIYVGDTRMDEVACRYAGIPFIWAAYGFGKTEKPDAVLYSFSDLEKTILTL